MNVTISQFEYNLILKRIIISSKVIIDPKEWKIINPIISIDNNSTKISELKFNSNFDLKRIKNIFENLSALNMWEIEKLKKEYKFLGYNTAVLDGYKHKLYSFPIYLTLMACIAAILMLNIKHNKSKIFHISVGILISVVIYYINYFFNVIIETQDVPYLISIWGPQLIFAMIVLTNLFTLTLFSL